MPKQANTCRPADLSALLADELDDGARETIELHLDSCTSCRSRLDELAGGDSWWSQLREHLSSEPELPTCDGRYCLPDAEIDLSFLGPTDFPHSLGRLGCYEVTGVIGRGGMGIVLKAQDPALQRPVAIKVLASEMAASAAARKRFAREAQAAAAVVHDHVVAVHRVEPDAKPPYLVMAYVPGRSLQERLDREGPLELREVLRIGMQTASGLAAAHAQGIVHRDIKPANIVLENGVERVKITDFGLARAADDASVTRSGAVAGTPQFMSPEQARGEAVDPRTDLFSLGSTLYAMCAGRPPFRGTNGLNVLRKVCDETPSALRSVNADVPEWLEAIIAKLMSKDPAARFATATEVAELLEGCLAHVQQPLATKLPAACRRIVNRKTWRRAIGVAAAAVTGVSIAVYWPGNAPGEAEKNVQLARQNDVVATPVATDRTDEMIVEVGERVRRLEASMIPAPKDVDPVNTELRELNNRIGQLRREMEQNNGGSTRSSR